MLVGEILKFGYRPHIGNVEVKFPLADQSRKIEKFTVGQVDGQTKILCMYAILAACKDLELSEEEMKDQDLCTTLSSFVSIRCSFRFFDNPADYFLEALRRLAKT